MSLYVSHSRLLYCTHAVYDYPLCNVATAEGIAQKGMSQFLKQPVTLQ